MSNCWIAYSVVQIHQKFHLLKLLLEEFSDKQMKQSHFKPRQKITCLISILCLVRINRKAHRPVNWCLFKASLLLWFYVTDLTATILIHKPQAHKERPLLESLNFHLCFKHWVKLLSELTEHERGLWCLAQEHFTPGRCWEDLTCELPITMLSPSAAGHLAKHTPRPHISRASLTASLKARIDYNHLQKAPHYSAEPEDKILTQ